MTMRIGVDLDGVLADLAAAYRDVDQHLFGTEAEGDEAPESPTDEGTAAAGAAGETAEGPRVAVNRPREERRRREVVWRAIEATEDFWTTLGPTEAGVVARLAGAAARHRWEVFFITKRPETSGDTAQRQTQRWLAAHGFDLPSVIVARGPRGRLAAVLELDYLVDDTPQNAVDVVSDSKARVILVDRSGAASVEANARRFGVAVVRSAGEALDLLERVAAGAESPTLLDRLAKLVGWKSGD